MDALDLVSASVAAEQAREAVAMAEDALGAVGVGIRKAREDLAKLDALTTVNPTQMIALENGRRLVRKLTTEDRPAAESALASAHAALVEADREVSRLKCQQVTRDLARVEQELTATVEGFVTAFHSLSAKRESLEGDSRRFASGSGEEASIRGSTWKLPPTARGVILNLNGLGEYRRDRFFIELARVYQAHVDHLTAEKRATLDPVLPVVEPVPTPARPDPLAAFALGNWKRNEEARTVAKTQASWLSEIPSAESAPDLDYDPYS